MITISELANELNISKNAINHRIDTLGMKHKLTKIGNKYVLNDQQANRIRAIYGADNQQTDQTNSTKDETNEQLKQSVFVALETLQRELEAKNKQIEELHQIIKTLELTKLPKNDIIETIEDKQQKQAKPTLFERLFGKRNNKPGEETDSAGE